MRLYLEIARLSFRRHRAYGAANVAGLITNAFFGLVRSYVFIALYLARPEAEGYRLIDALTYVWLTQALIMVVMIWGWSELALTIQTGDVVSDLSKPWSFFNYWLSRDAGRMLYYILYRGAPTLLLGWLLFRVRLPERPETWALFAVSVLLAVAISFCIRFLINVSAFWSTDVRGLNGIAVLLVNFLSGFLVPLEFFPPILRRVAEALPFASMISVPTNIFLERAVGGDTLVLLARQLAWAATLVLVCDLLLRVATRKLVVQGG